MTIRPATVAEVPRLVAMGRRMRAETTYRAWIADTPAQLTTLFTQLVESPASVILVADADAGVVGMLGVGLAPHPFSGVRLAVEVMWWMDPEARGHGAALWRAAECWAAEHGATALQMVAPAGPAGDRVGRLYQRRGYQPIETTYSAPVTEAMSAITVVDEVWPDVAAYRTQALAQPFADAEPSPGVVFHGIAPAPDDSLPAWIQARWPALTPTQTFVRQSPAGQAEPTFIHTDDDMGDWTAIAYLTADPPPEDGTTFWRQTATGVITHASPLAADVAWDDPTQWEAWTTVPARPGRVVLFPAGYYHSRALAANYGTGDTARLIQLVFGTGAVPPRRNSMGIATAIAVGSIAASAYGAHKASSAAKKASEQQAASADKALALQGQQYQQTRQDLGPYREQGGQGLTALTALLGLPAAPAGGPAAAAQPPAVPPPPAFSPGPTFAWMLEHGWMKPDQVQAAATQLAAKRGLAPAGAGGQVLLKAPNGQTRPVPADQVDFYLARGATRG